MYDVYYESGEKAFGCSSLDAVREYMKDIGVATVIQGTNALGKTEARINLVNGEYILVNFGCPTAASVWIQVWVPGNRVGITSIKSGCIYNYEKVDA